MPSKRILSCFTALARSLLPAQGCLLWTGCLLGVAGLLSLPAQARQKIALTVGPDIPHILTGEVDLLYTPRWNVGFNGGGFAYTLKSGGNPTPLSIAAGNVRLRFHPFAGSFFIGSAIGLQNIAGSHSQTFDVTVSGQAISVPANASATVLSPYFTPYLGWFVSTRLGFTFALELGYQFNFNTQSHVNVGIDDPNLATLLSVVQSTPQYTQAISDIQSKINQYGNLNLPYAAFRLGWTF